MLRKNSRHEKWYYVNTIKIIKILLEHFENQIEKSHK